MNFRIKNWIHPDNSLQSYFNLKIEDAFNKQNHYQLILIEETLGDLLYYTLEAKKKSKYEELEQFKEEEKILGDLLFDIRSKIFALEQEEPQLIHNNIKIEHKGVV